MYEVRRACHSLSRGGRDRNDVYDGQSIHPFCLSLPLPFPSTSPSHTHIPHNTTPRPRGVNRNTKTNHYKHQRDDSSPLLGPRLAAAPTSAKHHRRIPLPSHHPASSQTSLTPHYQHIYNVRAPQPRPQQARHTRGHAVLSGTGVKRAPPRAWDEWDDEALDRRLLRRRRYRPAEQAQAQEWHQHPDRQNDSSEQRPRARARANSSARRQRPVIDVGNGNGTSFAARAQRGGRGALDDVLRAAMYDGDGDAGVVRVAAPVGGRRRGRRGGGGGPGAGEGGFGVGIGGRGRPRPWPPAGGLEGWM
ncbi:uncharacterized protein J3D65DRAFT_173979 [Phyllosticta citribraziliensis]|uniref:Uncharacterized protein n=1 Tax=Phyllosticta citribraziliensis TaxID=989973 RepID=A0ABR1L5D4_9PEZI